MTDRDPDIEISKSQGFVIGDYARVFNYFNEAPLPIASAIRSPQQRTLVEERTRNFIGREYVIREIDRVIADPGFESGYVIVVGEPGIGKTALAAFLVLRGAYVHHFNIAPENVRSPRQFLENVCAQLVAKYELDYTTLPPDVGDDAGFLNRLLAEAAARSQERGTGALVIVIDALDEAEDVGLSPGENRLRLPRALPQGVFIVVTTREESDFRLDVDNSRDIWIRDDDPKNEADVAAYVDRYISENTQAMDIRIRDWGLDTDEFTARIVRLAEGNFMYLRHVLPDIVTGRLSRSSIGAIEGLPYGLVGYYKRHWRVMKDINPTRFVAIQRPILCFLAISREPVTITQLTEWTSLERGDARTVLNEWRPFLNEDMHINPHRYRIYHSSFAEFLNSEEELRWYHEKLVQLALAKLEQPGNNPRRR